MLTLSGPFWNYATGTLTSWEGPKVNHIIQLNCREVRTHASYKKKPLHGKTLTTEEQK